MREVLFILYDLTLRLCGISLKHSPAPRPVLVPSANPPLTREAPSGVSSLLFSLLTSDAISFNVSNRGERSS
jgi:hypothetical protein